MMLFSHSVVALCLITTAWSTGSKLEESLLPKRRGPSFDACPESDALVSQLEARDPDSTVDPRVLVENIHAGVQKSIIEEQNGIASQVSPADRQAQLIGRAHKMLWKPSVDVYKLAFSLAAVASGVSFQVADGASARLGAYIDADPVSGKPTSLGCVLTTTYAFIAQSAIMAMTLPFDRSALPMHLQDAPKHLFIGGVALAVQVASGIVAIPHVGVVMTGLVNLIAQIGAGLSIDKFGFMNLVPRRRVTTGQLMGGMVTLGGLMATLNPSGFESSASNMAAIVPWLGLVATRGVLTPMSAVINGALSEYSGSAMRSGMIAYQVGALVLSLASIIGVLAQGGINSNLQGSEWWMWVASCSAVVGQWGSAYLPSRIGVGSFVSFVSASYTVSSVATGALGVFGDPEPMTILKSVGALMCLVGMKLVQSLGGEVIEECKTVDDSYVTVV